MFRNCSDFIFNTWSMKNIKTGDRSVLHTQMDIMQLFPLYILQLFNVYRYANDCASRVMQLCVSQLKFHYERPNTAILWLFSSDSAHIKRWIKLTSYETAFFGVKVNIKTVARIVTEENPRKYIFACHNLFNCCKHYYWLRRYKMTSSVRDRYQFW